MMYVALVAFLLLMGCMIREMSHDEVEAENISNFYRSEYTVLFTR